MIKWFILSLLIFIICAIIYPLEIVYAFDVKGTLFFEKLRTTYLTDVFLFISDLGSIKYKLPLCLVIAVFLLIKKRVLDVVFLFVMFYSVRQLNYQLKEIFLRDRPPFNSVYEASHYSFPSGHSMNSMAIYSFLCYLFISHLTKTNNQKQALLITTMILIFLIGISRIYLGVHYITDVLAGFSAGFAWFIVIAIIFTKTNKQFDNKDVI